MAANNPSLRERQPFKAALERDMTYLSQVSEVEVMELLTATHSNITQEQFEAEVRAFFETVTHPTLGVPIANLVYKPMRELLDYLRANGFQTWICSGGGIDFMRIVTEQIYGIPPQQVIGSSGKKNSLKKTGRIQFGVYLRLAKLTTKPGSRLALICTLVNVLYSPQGMNDRVAILPC